MMDERAFGEWSRQVGAARSRRGTLRALVGGLVAAGVLRGVEPAAAQEVGEEAFGFCRPANFPCIRDKQCCAGRCTDAGVCHRRKKGGRCIAGVGAACCSGRCRKGKCK
jgi:hypothetical protein